MRADTDYRRIGECEMIFVEMQERLSVLRAAAHAFADGYGSGDTVSEAFYGFEADLGALHNTARRGHGIAAGDIPVAAS